MVGIFCRQVRKFERGQMFRHHCVGCAHNTAHLGDAKLYCRYLEHRHSSGAGRLTNSKPFIQIPTDLRG